MSLKGFDIASHQAGMDAGKAAGDFAIIKATQGTTYTNPYFSRHYSQAAAAGKLLGAYHYASGGDPVKEADYFLTVVGHRAGNCILCLDWEHNKGGGENYVFNTPAEVDWCRKFAQRIRDRTGTWPLIYMSASVTRRRNWGPVAQNCPLWLAQYGSTEITDYQSSPWRDGRALGAWGYNIAIHQYSPSGSISGYRQSKPHKLDINIAYISAETWAELAAGRAAKAAPAEFPDKTDSELAIEVLFDLHGRGDARREKLGSRYGKAQDMVEYYLDSAGDMLAAIMAYQKKFGAQALVKK